MWHVQFYSQFFFSLVFVFVNKTILNKLLIELNFLKFYFSKYFHFFNFYLSIFLYIFNSIYLYISIYLINLYIYIYLTCLCIYLYIYLSIYLSMDDRYFMFLYMFSDSRILHQFASLLQIEINKYIAIYKYMYKYLYLHVLYIHSFVYTR